MCFLLFSSVSFPQGCREELFHVPKRGKAKTWKENKFPVFFFQKENRKFVFFFPPCTWLYRMDRVSWPNLAFQAAGGRILSYLISRILGLSEPWGLREVHKKNAWEPRAIVA
jgi:hypothetical protein